mgnify:FL=1
MMNNKGQSLVLFILIIPILIGVMALVIDCGRVIEVKNHQENICYLSLEYGLDYEEKSILEDILRLNLENTKYQVNRNGENVDVVLEDEVDGVFSRMFGFLKFRVKSKYQGSLVDNKKVIKKVL